MLIWLITTGEILPTGNDRAHRTGMLSKMLAEKGHKVIWWTTTFDHQTKSFMGNANEKRSISANLDLYFLHSTTGYKRNVSVQRLINHAGVAKNFANRAEAEKQPDLIFCSFPTIDLSYDAVKYGKENQVPVVLDVRDLWPDIFFQPFPRLIHPIIKIPLLFYIFKAQKALKNCTAITAVSEGYLDWALNYAKRKRKATDRIFPLGYHKESKTENPETEAQLYYSEKGISTEKISVWFVGTFGQTYDLSPVIITAKELSELKQSEIQFIFTGDGEKMAEWKKQAEGLNNIVFTGWATKKELGYLKQAATIGLMAYREGAPQGLPNKIFEYLSLGIPILSSLKGETQELLYEHNCGLTFDADNFKSLKKQLLSLIDNPLLIAEMGENGKELFESEYSSEIIYPKLISYLENIIKQY